MQRVQLILQDELFIDYINRNTEAERERPFCKHDLTHMIDVARIAYILVLEHQDLEYFIQTARLSSRMAAKELIYTAGLLHDIGKWKEYESGTDHAAFGSHLVRELLPRLDFTENEASIIAQAVFEHRNISKEMSFLGERLHRADNLSRVCSQCDENQDCIKFKNKEMGSTLLVY